MRYESSKWCQIGNGSRGVCNSPIPQSLPMSIPIMSPILQPPLCNVTSIRAQHPEEMLGSWNIERQVKPHVTIMAGSRANPAGRGQSEAASPSPSLPVHPSPRRRNASGRENSRSIAASGRRQAPSHWWPMTPTTVGVVVTLGGAIVPWREMEECD
jgi:hypothetical protein